MRFAVLGSGSRGNSALVSTSDSRVLIDCGFPLRETLKRLARLGIEPGELHAILVTHEHADHIHGVELLARHYGIPVYLSAGTLNGLRKPVQPAGLLKAGDVLAIRGLEVTAVGVSHDAREPLQYVLSDGRWRFGLLTDLGSPTPEVLQCYRGLDALIVEANHDSEMLARGPYPYPLKVRVGGLWGHMNNQQSANLVADLGWEQLQHLVLAHLSEKNNTPELARRCFVDTLGCDPDWLQVADQQSGLDWRHIA
ncbi:MAG: putative metallo-hydrolase YycJ [Stenotrophomonas maltophilia]|nr:MAG: putative metallo-hydrolase YycJ [Stenotrophomonas maltophilia]